MREKVTGSWRRGGIAKKSHTTWPWGKAGAVLKSPRAALQDGGPAERTRVLLGRGNDQIGSAQVSWSCRFFSHHRISEFLLRSSTCGVSPRISATFPAHRSPEHSK